MMMEIDFGGGPRLELVWELGCSPFFSVSAGLCVVCDYSGYTAQKVTKHTSLTYVGTERRKNVLITYYRRNRQK